MLRQANDTMDPGCLAGGSHLLDRVVWRALTGYQAAFADGDARARIYKTAIAPFADVAEPTPECFRALADLLLAGGRAAVLREIDAQVLPDLKVAAPRAIEQMLAPPMPACAPAAPIVRLGSDDVAEMIQLTNLTKPGPFGARTIDLGAYYGIRKEGHLAAMAGERMKIDGYTEISAVCTHPDCRGHGYGRTLLQFLAHEIQKTGAEAMLHVFADNRPAISLYQALGFRTRRTLPLTVLVRPG